MKITVGIRLHLEEPDALLLSPVRCKFRQTRQEFSIGELSINDMPSLERRSVIHVKYRAGWNHKNSIIRACAGNLLPDALTL